MNDDVVFVSLLLEFFALGAYFALKVGDHRAPKRSRRRFPVRMALLGAIAICMIARRCFA